MPVRRSPVRAFFRRYVIALGVATAVMVTSVFAVNYVIDRKISKIARVKVDVAAPPPEGANYLLIGSDTRAFAKNKKDKEKFGDEADGEVGGQRSDTMMVVHVEPDARRTLVVSFPRDMYVEVPGEGEVLINSTFNDGAQKVIDTITSNFDIEINHYLEVDFKTFRGIVDAIGTVPVYFPYAARDQKTGLYVTLPGCLRLDGTSALSYVRSRSLEYYSNTRKRWMNADNTPDIDRIARQQDFMRKLAGLAVQKSLNNPITANDIADRVLEHLKIDDNLTKDDIFNLIDAFRTINPNDQSALEFQTLPWKEGPDQKGQSVLYPDEPKASEMITRLNDFSDSGSSSTASVDPAKVKVRVLNGTGLQGAASAVRARFVELGFADGGTANDPRRTVAQTEIRYQPGAVDKAKTVFRSVNPDARLVEDETLKRADVAVVVGANFESVVAPSASTTTTTAAPSVAPTTTTTSASGSSPQTSTPADTRSGTPVPIPNQSQLGTAAPKTPPC
jgi:LCP family protein required for cell wall assembly